MTRSNILMTAIALPVLLFSCGQQTREETNVTTASTEAEQELCFLHVSQGEQRMQNDEMEPGAIDSLSIRLIIKDGHVTGKMDWLPEEKDRMTGTLDGTIQDNIITAVYTYQAEGVSAREEKIFKLDTNSIWLKAGELVEKDGIWVLEDKASAFFGQSVPKVPCR